jgi:hypothetical protein
MSSWMRFGVVLGLVFVGAVTLGCSYVGNTVNGYTTARTPTEAFSDAGVGMGLVEPGNCGPCGAPSPLGAEWGRSMQRTNQFFAHHVFNYDVNDPYRGHDAGRLGEFIGVYALNYDVHDPYRGDCVIGW